MAQDSRLSLQRRLGGAAVITLTALTYLNALHNGLVWDDPIVLDRQLRAFHTLGDVFFPPAHIPQFSPDYYRPLTTLSYLIDRALGGTGPFTFHLSVVLYHLVATLLVYRLGIILLDETLAGCIAAAVGAGLFGVHPIHTESVAWGAGRSDVIASAFAIGATVVYLQPRWSTPRRTTLAAMLVFLGMLAKETAGAVLFLLPISDWILPRTTALPTATSGRAERRRQRQASSSPPPQGSQLARYVPFAVAVIVYVGMRRAALGLMVGDAEPLSAAAAVNLCGALGFYLSKLVLPLGQSAFVSDLPTQPIQLATIAVASIGFALALFLSWQRGHRTVTFALLWIAITIAPSLAIVLKIPTAPVAERYLYLPSVGFCVLVGYAVAALTATPGSGPRAILTWTACAFLLAGAAAATVRRNAIWRTNLSLWEDTAAKNTTDGLPLRSLAAAQLDLGDATKAEELFRAALQRRNNVSGQYTIYNNLGTLAMQRKNLDDAERYYRTAMSLNPEPEVIYNLGLIALTRAMESDASHDQRWKQEQAETARRWFEQGAQQSPLDPDIQIALGQALSAAGNGAAARPHFERALALGVSPSTEAAVRKLLETAQ